jgi:hypothetical protein
MISQEIIKKNKVKLPAPGWVIIMLLKKNKAVKCTVLRVGKVNSTVQIKGVETKVPNDQVDIDDDYLYPDGDD